MTGPQIGVDEWVAQEEERRLRRSGLAGALEPVLGRVPWWAQLGLFLALCSLLPLASDSGYVRRVAFDTTLYILLALGLNVVVGWGGLLDLGYIAFYGFGAYGYAVVSSDQFGVHLPTVLAIPFVVAAAAVVGYLLGLTSWRLVGDYLAIVTLFFGQIFLTLLINGDKALGQNVTNGTQGISSIDPLSFFGRALPVAHEGIFNVAYLYIALAFFAVVYVGLHFLNASRTGRAWRALREDSLAAELMSMPVDRLKLLAFAFGAGTAGLTGSLFASLNAGVFPENFALPLLITIYAMVILGGAGSQAGVVIGAIVVNTMLEALRSQEHARWVFYVAILACVVIFVRPWLRIAVVVAGTAGVGLVAHAVAHAIDPSWTGGAVQGSDAVARAAGHWVVIPTHLGKGEAVSYVALVAAALLLTTLRGWIRVVATVPTVYLAAFVWENVMAEDPASTRFVILGALLVGVMTTRPAGLLGEARVEIV
jgi:ABC-type branched-subunit amino acid transport system permease subunit